MYIDIEKLLNNDLSKRHLPSTLHELEFSISLLPVAHRCVNEVEEISVSPVEVDHRGRLGLDCYPPLPLHWQMVQHLPPFFYHTWRRWNDRQGAEENLTIL